MTDGLVNICWCWTHNAEARHPNRRCCQYEWVCSHTVHECRVTDATVIEEVDVAAIAALTPGDTDDYPGQHEGPWT